ncbi:MAG: ribosome maturation factor RimM [Woeseiaceae bacterium]
MPCAVAQGTNTVTTGDPVILGRVSGLYGVKGWVRVFSYTEPAEALLGYRSWQLRQGQDWAGHTLAEGRKHGKSLVARLAEIEDRDQAAALVGADIAVDRHRLPAAGEGEYYWADLEGLEVRHRDGRRLGRVVRMLATGANDVMVVQAADEPGREILIPFVPAVYILNVDVAGRVIDIDWEWD